MSEVLDEVTAQLLRASPSTGTTEGRLRRIAVAWPSIVGELLCRSTRPVRLVDYTLVVAVDASRWAEALRFQTRTVMGRVRRVDRGVERLSIEAGPERAPAPPPPPESPVDLPPLPAIDDAELQAAFAGAVAAWARTRQES